MIQKHDGVIEEDFTGAMHQASCSCGWSGPLRDTDKEAMTDLQKHYGLIGE